MARRSKWSRSAHDAAESDVARGSVDRLGVAGGGLVAAAIIRRAQMRAALEHLAGDADLRLAWVVALGLRPAARILRHAARFSRLRRMARGPEIRRPLPDIADHVVDAVAVGR